MSLFWVAIRQLVQMLPGNQFLKIVSCWRLALKTTDINWVKAKDLGDHMGYYKDKYGFKIDHALNYFLQAVPVFQS